MNQESPETKENVEPQEVESEGKDEGLEIARKLNKGELQMEELSTEQYEEFHNRFVVEEEEIPEDGEASEPVEAKEEVPEKEVQTEPPKEESLQKKYYEKSNELNRVSQLLQNKEKRIKELEGLAFQPKKVKHEDPLSDEAIQSRDERLEAIERNQSQIINVQKQTLAKEVEELQNERLFLGIANFQQLEPEAKTTKPFQVLNAAYTKFQNDLGGPEARQRFLEDADFRKQKEAEGHVFPMGETDWNAYKKVVAIHKFREEGSYPTYSSAFADWKLQNGIVSDPVKDAVIRTTQSITQKVAGNSGTTVVLDPQTGKSHQQDGDGMTDEWMEDWITKHPYPSTPQEVLTQQKIMEKLRKNRSN